MNKMSNLQSSMLSNRFNYMPVNNDTKVVEVAIFTKAPRKLFGQQTQYVHETNKDGFTEIKKIQVTININERIIATPSNIIPDENSIEMFIGGKRKVLCKKWVESCYAPINSRITTKCSHPYSEKCEHLDRRLCLFFKDNKCYNTLCGYYHASFAPIITMKGNSNFVTQNKIKTSMCLKHVLHTINPSNPPCTWHNCKFAHSLKEISGDTELQRFDREIINKIDLQQLYNHIVEKMVNYKDNIMKLCADNEKQRPYYSEPIPRAFIEYMDSYNNITFMAYKTNKELYEKINLDNSFLVKGFISRNNICKKNLDVQIKILSGRSSMIKAEDICIHETNCMYGVHVSTYKDGMINHICTGELMGLCKCEMLTCNQIEEKRKNILNHINQLKTEQKTLIDQSKTSIQSASKEIEMRLGFVKKAIYDKSREFFMSYRKIHLVRDFDYQPLKSVKAEIEKSIDIFDEGDFKVMDTNKMTADELVVYNKTVDERNIRLVKHLADIKIRKQQEEVREKADKEAVYKNAHELFLTTQDNNIREWFESGAWEYMPPTHYTMNKDIYTNWIKNPLGCTFDSFTKFVKGYIDLWTNNQESHHFKKYRNVWCYVYDIPVESDPFIIGTGLCANIPKENPELWSEYLDKHSLTGYTKSFTEFIETDTQLKQALELLKDNNKYTFSQAVKYVKNDIAKTGISFSVYCNYDNHTIVMWKMINEICTQNQMNKISIADFIKDKQNHIDFYIRSGRYTYGTNTDGYEHFIKDKKAGWNICHRSMKLNEYSSLLAMPIDQLREFFKKQSIWSIEMMRKHEGYAPVITYTLNSKSVIYTIFSSIVDKQIKDLYTVLMSPEITNLETTSNITFTKNITDQIAIVKTLVDEIKNASTTMDILCKEFPNKKTDLSLLKTQFGDSLPLLSLADKVLTIYKDNEGKRKLNTLKVRKVIVEEEDDSSDDDSSDDDSSDDDFTNEFDDDANIYKETQKKELFELMPLGYDYKMYIRNEHPNDMRIDKTSSQRKIYFGPFPESDNDKLQQIVDTLKESRFGKGCNLGASIIKLEDTTDRKASSLHLSVNDKGLNNKSNRFKAKENRQSNVEDAYGYDWVADMFINVINKEFNVNIKEVLTNIFTLEARMNDHISRNIRHDIKEHSQKAEKVVKKPIKSQSSGLSKDEKTALIRAKLEAKKLCA